MDFSCCTVPSFYWQQPWIWAARTRNASEVKGHQNSPLDPKGKVLPVSAPPVWAMTAALLSVRLSFTPCLHLTWKWTSPSQAQLLWSLLSIHLTWWHVFPLAHSAVHPLLYPCSSFLVQPVCEGKQNLSAFSLLHGLASWIPTEGVRGIPHLPLVPEHLPWMGSVRYRNLMLWWGWH